MPTHESLVADNCAGWFKPYLRHISIFLFIVAAFVLVVRFSRDDDRYRRQDFSRYYSDTMAVKHGVDPYLRKETTQIAYPPAFYLAFTPLTLVPPTTAHWIWEGIQIISLAAAIVIALREAGIPISSEFALCVFALSFLFPPLQTSLHYGQPTSLLLLLLVASWSQSRHGDDIAAGALLASAVLLKAFPWVMAGYVIMRRRWTVLGWAAAFAVFISICLIGTYGIKFNLDFLENAHVQNIWLDRPRNLSVLSNIRAFVQAIVPAGFGAAQQLTHSLVILVDLILIGGAAVFTARANANTSYDDGLCWGLWMFTTILLAPVAWDHYLVLVLPAYMFLAVCVWIHATELTERSLMLSGMILVAFGLVGFVIVPYIQYLKDLRSLFFLAIASYIGLCLLLWDEQRSKGFIKSYLLHQHKKKLAVKFGMQPHNTFKDSSLSWIDARADVETNFD